MSKKYLYEARWLPVFQNRMYETVSEARACPKGDVILVENLETGLVYNDVFNPDLMDYDKHYQNEQAVSSLFRNHLEDVVKIISQTMGKESIVEIGCGKGFFLEMLLANNFDVTGFDPAYEGKNQRVIKKYFSSGHGIKANGLILRHVLEHIQNPLKFLSNLKEENHGSGRVYIEVPCFDWICKHRAWFDIFYEHVNYFRCSDFYRMFDVIHESGHMFGNQYFYIVAELSSFKNPKIDLADRVSFPDNFVQHLNNSVENTECNQSAVWGAASKGVIFALFKERAGGGAVNMTIDINPAKQGRFLPATGLQVFSPEEAMSKLPDGSTIYVMNSNYMEEIKQMSKNAYNYIGVVYE